MLFDIIWTLSDGVGGTLGIAANWISNAVSFSLFAAACLIWFIYSETVQGSRLLTARYRMAFVTLPAVLVVVLAFTSYWTHALFYIDAQGAYRRGFVYMIQPIVSYCYVIYTSLHAFIQSCKVESLQKKAIYQTLAFFAIPALVAGVFQVFYSGPCLSVGIMLSMLQLYIVCQEQLISTDPLTGLNNRNRFETYMLSLFSGADQADDVYLLMMDADGFKLINDRYGHVEGDHALQVISATLKEVCSASGGFIARYGGDEFVVFLKDIPNTTLLQKTRQLSESVQQVKFWENDYRMTCSIGACFLPENTAGYSFDQLFENADWALYQAKQNGRNQYVFCDNLRRYAQAVPAAPETADIDARYLHNDLISTAFELFEKNNSFETAIPLFLKIVGIRLQLDRITIVDTRIRERSISRQFQWTSPRAEPVPLNGESYTKEDFLTLFHSYDEYGTTVLQADNMGMYSPQGRALLMQGGAQTVVYAAMYGEGEYQGAIAYVVCGSKRYWTPQNRRELGEITKIINAYLSKHLAVNAVSRGMTSAPEFDRLTGLLAFSRFKEEVFHKIIGGYAEGFQIFYCDFENFKYFNEKYSYATGDQLLKEFSDFLIEAARHWGECFLCRVVGDQFVLYLSCRDEKGPLHYADTLCHRFEQYQAQHYPEVRLRVRMGVYAIEPGCLSASAAIDKANFARKQVHSNTRVSAVQFDKKLEVKQTLTGELLSGLPQALENGEFKLYLQPKFSPKDLSVIGAEALTRWIKPDGTVVYPDQFIPILESTGRIVELDLYIFEQVAQFLQRNAQAGHRLLPIAVNASAVLAREDAPTQDYSEILEKHNISARMLEIELTETAVVSEYDRVKRLLSSFQSDGMQTSLDDFGAGGSLLNNMVDIPVNTIKLDKLFLTRCSSNARGTDFLREIVHLVKRLGYNVICEGIETEEQVQLLRSLDCDGAQGFWFSKAIPAEEFERRYLCD